MREIKRILCPVDLSDQSRHAAEHALVIARWYGASITVLHVCNPLTFPAHGVGLSPYSQPAALTEEEKHQIRQDVLAVVPPEAAGDVRIDTGDPTARILERAASIPADLILIGTHGLGGFEYLVLGSITEKVLRKAACPVLTVPPRSQATSTLPFKRILCAVDFSDSSVAALELAFSFAQEGDADLIVLHVVEWPQDEPPAERLREYRESRQQSAEARLRELVPEMDWCRPATRLAHGKPYREILNVAAAERADLIVMGVQGRNAFNLMLFGSTTNQVVRAATCPVLTLRR